MSVIMRIDTHSLVIEVSDPNMLTENCYAESFYSWYKVCPYDGGYLRDASGEPTWVYPV